MKNILTTAILLLSVISGFSQSKTLYENDLSTAKQAHDWTLNAVKWNSSNGGQLVFEKPDSYVILPKLPESTGSLKLNVKARYGDYIRLFTSPDSIAFSNQGTFRNGNKNILDLSGDLPKGTRYVKLVALNGTINDVYLISVNITETFEKANGTENVKDTVPKPEEKQITQNDNGPKIHPPKPGTAGRDNPNSPKDNPNLPKEETAETPVPPTSKTEATTETTTGQHKPEIVCPGDPRCPETAAPWTPPTTNQKVPTPTNATEKKFVALIRANEKLPRYLFEPIFQVVDLWAQKEGEPIRISSHNGEELIKNGVLTIAYADWDKGQDNNIRYHEANLARLAKETEESGMGKLMGVNNEEQVANSKKMIETYKAKRQLYVHLSLAEWAKPYLASKEQWTQPNAKITQHGSWISKIDVPFADPNNQYMLRGIPEYFHNIPKFHGVADLGTVDFMRIEAIVKAPANPYITDEEYTVYWTGYFSKETPFSAAYSQTPLILQESSITMTKDGKVKKFRTYGGGNRDEFMKKLKTFTGDKGDKVLYKRQN